MPIAAERDGFIGNLGKRMKLFAVKMTGCDRKMSSCDPMRMQISAPWNIRYLRSASRHPHRRLLLDIV